MNPATKAKDRDRHGEYVTANIVLLFPYFVFIQEYALKHCLVDLVWLTDYMIFMFLLNHASVFNSDNLLLFAITVKGGPRK